MRKLELKFSREKETKNTVRYQEELGDEAHSSRADLTSAPRCAEVRDIAVGSLYIQKSALGEPVPQKLKVTIEPEEGL